MLNYLLSLARGEKSEAGANQKSNCHIQDIGMKSPNIEVRTYVGAQMWTDNLPSQFLLPGLGQSILETCVTVYHPYRTSEKEKHISLGHQL